jgi:hypothetical protein
MTETKRWLEGRRRELLWRTAGAGLLLTGGMVLLALASGVLLGRLGLYQRLPPTVLLAWIAAVGAAGWGLTWWQRRARGLGLSLLAARLERTGGQRRGAIAGVAAWEQRDGGASLASLADTRMKRWLEERGGHALHPVRHEARRSVRAGATLFGAAALLFAGSGPVTGRGAAFWQPVAILAQVREPVVLTVDRTAVRRGEHVAVAVRAPGRRRAALWVRAPGEPWRQLALALDTAGRAATTVGPLDSDRYLRAESGGRSSETVHVRVALPALLADLLLVARYPGYLERADEPVAPGEDSVRLPMGTAIITRGRATVELAGAAWRGPGAVVRLPVDGASFRGALQVRRTGEWRLEVIPRGGGLMDQEPAALKVVALPDAPPVVAVPIPGRDTTAPLSLRQPLLIDARDDHRLTSVELVSWRVSRFGVEGAALTEPVPLPEGGADRAVLHWLLDLNGRGFLPGDTAYFQVRAHDSRPNPQVGESPVYRLRLPALAELRQAMRDRARSVTVGADSLARAQGELTREIEDLAAERERGAQGDPQHPPDSRAPDQLPFGAAERARELLDREQQVLQRARDLGQEMSELADAAWSAGLTDPEFQRQLREIQSLLERSLSPELAARLEELRAALARLDAEGARTALRELAREAQLLRDELARSRELFQRAAIEGELTSLSRDAEELAAEQREWNELAQEGVDSAQADAEEALAQRTDSLASQLERLDLTLDSMMQGAGLAEAPRRAQVAGQRMQQAADQGRRGRPDQARRSGEEASEALDPLASLLEERRDELRDTWRQEVMQQLERAMVETAELAKRQQEITSRLDRGDVDADVRGAQAAAREGVDRIIEQLQGAAGKNALVSPRLGAALGLAKLRMGEALDRVQRANPDAEGAEALSGEAVDALTAVIYSLLAAQGQVENAQSGSGLEEAVERLAELANQQGELNGQAGGMLSLMPAGGEQLMQELQALAQRQRALAQELERLNAGGEVSGADELAEEAEDIARQLEQGRLDRELVERQERLFRRLLDAGRTLESDEEDEQRERVSEAADPGNVVLPEASEAPVAAPRYRFPTWEELRALSPEVRRLILDYFRRLNDARP